MGALLKNTGERQVDPDNVAPDHLARYKLAAAALKGLKVLDAGCGIGYGSRILAEADCVVVAYDTSVDAIDAAMTNLAHDRIEYRCRDVAECDEPFDAVVAFELIEHVKDPVALIKTLSERAPRILASVPNEEVLPFDSRRFPFHCRHFTPKEFEWLIGQGGYELKQRFGQKQKWDDHISKNWDEARTLIAYGWKQI